MDETTKLPESAVNSAARLAEVAEPDDAFLIASEQESELTAQRRALAVIVTDHPEDFAEEVNRLVSELLTEGNFQVDAVVTVRSKKAKIRRAIETAVVGGVDLVLTVGGTGVGPRDKTPEATQSVLDMEVPGIAQAVRSSGMACAALDAGTSRGVSGVSGSTVVVNLASSRTALRDGMATVIPLVHHIVDQLQKYSV